MIAIKKILILNLVFLTQIACSQKLTLTRVNRPSEENFKKELKGITESYKDSAELNKQTVKEETYYFSRSIELRNKVLDSLDILKSKKLIIIDAIKDFNGRRSESTYFFYDNKILIAGYTGNTQLKGDHSYVIETSKNLLKEEHSDDVLNVNDYFNKDTFNQVQGAISFNHFVYFNVTLILNEEIGYYTIRSDSEGYKIIRQN